VQKYSKKLILYYIPPEKAEIWQKAGRKVEDKDKQGVQKIQQIYTPTVEIRQDQNKLLTYFYW
jgi:hypothetical protein